MGNGTTLNQKQTLPVNFEEIKRQQHPILGPIRFIVNKHDQKRYILVQRVFASENQYQRCLKKVKNRSKLSKMHKRYLPNEFILQILQYRSMQYNEVCGKSFRIFNFMQQFDCELKKVFQERKRRRNIFLQSQILELTLQIVNCLIQLHEHNIKPFSLSMSSIVQSANNYKLIDCELTNQMNPVDQLKFKFQLKKGTYLAPQILSRVDQEQGSYILNSSRSDVFTLGILLLQLSTLRELGFIFDYDRRQIDFSQIQSIVRGLEYSSAFKSVLGKMLQQQESERVGLLRLKELIRGQGTTTAYNHTLNKLDEIGCNSVLGDKKLIYLGKQPNVRRSSNSQNLTLESRQTFKAKDSFHPLLNQIADQRSKKSFSFNQSFTLADLKLTNQQRETPLLKKHLYDLSQRNHIAHESKRCQSGSTHNLSQIRSDRPISPITLQRKAQNPKQIQHFGYIKNRAGLPLREQSFKISYASYGSNNIKQTTQSQKRISEKPVNMINVNGKQNDGKILNEYKRDIVKQSGQGGYFKERISRQKQAVVSNKKGSKIRCPDMPPSNSQLIQQLQTPRINKASNFLYGESSFKPDSLRKMQPSIPEQTPIKSLQFMGSKNKQNTKDRDTYKKQVGRVFGRYDFQNGAVYEGQFSEENQFEGNGVLFFPNGRIFYSGSWRKNQFDGFGILNNIESQTASSIPSAKIDYKDFNLNDNSLWSQYEGQFLQDRKHGFGTLYFVNGDKFSGCFVNDSIQGFGHFARQGQGKPIMGIWAGNILRQP